ncbi:MAG: response regulator [Thermoanaerobaculales bacterium]|jgi:DNA-binding NtrC family response regulator|nr:response regulator [Thermoanaerobaculales bacterium]
MIEPSVLVVDDEVPFVETLVKRLDKRGVKVNSAHSGQEALDILETGGATKTDVVILDVKMPVMDGLETLSAIKEQHPLVEVIMLTGHATVESAIEGMKHGAFDYLMKPCDLDNLMAKLTEAANKKRDHEAKILEARASLISLRRGD